MAQKGWIFDLSKCVGCRACVAACAMENNTTPELTYRWVIEKESGTYPNPAIQPVSVACNHCANPACLASCPVAAITKNADGIVTIDESLCIGCKYCMAVCPYGAPQFNEITGKAEKCNYCLQRTAGGALEPACAKTCVGGAIQAAPDGTAWDGAPPTGMAKRAYTNPSIKILRS